MNKSHLSASVGIILALSGCGDDRSSDMAPEGALVFPPVDGLVTERDAVIIRGTASDTDGVIESVTVGAVAATSDDGFANWTAKVPLEAGLNDLDVAITDDAGGTATLSVNVERAVDVFPIYPTAIDVDSVTGRLFVSDSTGGELMELDPETAASSAVLFDRSTADGNLLVTPHESVLDITGNRLFVTNTVDAAARVVSIDLSTKMITEISGPSRGDGPELSIQGNPIRTLAYDGGSTLFVAGPFKLYRVDVDSGDRTPVHIPDSVSHNLITDVEWDTDTSVLYVGFQHDAVAMFDPVKDEWTVIAENGDDKGPMVASVRDLALDRASRKLYVASDRFILSSDNPRDGSMVAVDLSSGYTRSVVFEGSAMTEEFAFLDCIGGPLPGNAVAACNAEAHEIVRVDVSDGSMDVIRQSAFRRGTGPHWSGIQRSVGETDGDGLYVLDGDNTIVAVDPVTGARTILAEVAIPPIEGELSPPVSTLIADNRNQDLWLATNNDLASPDTLYRLNSTSGELHAVVFEVTEDTPLNATVGDMRQSLDGRYLYLRRQLGSGADTGLLEVDLESKTVRQIAGNTADGTPVGTGVETGYPGSFVPRGDIIQLFDNAENQLIDIDLATLERTANPLPEAFATWRVEGIAMFGDGFLLSIFDEAIRSRIVVQWQRGELPRMVVSSEMTKAALAFRSSSYFARLDDERSLLWFSDPHATHGLYVLDIETGESLLVSH